MTRDDKLKKLANRKAGAGMTILTDGEPFIAAFEDKIKELKEVLGVELNVDVGLDDLIVQLGHIEKLAPLVKELQETIDTIELPENVKLTGLDDLEKLVASHVKAINSLPDIKLPEANVKVNVEQIGKEGVEEITKKLDNVIDVLQTEKVPEIPQEASDFTPVRRVKKVGNSLIFDDDSWGGSGGGGIDPSLIVSSTANPGQRAIAVTNPDGSNISGGGGGGGSGDASASNQTNGNQKTQIVDAGGEAATVTGGKLDVNATVSLSIDQPLTDAQLRATPVEVDTGLTQPTTPADTQPVSGTVTANLGTLNGASTASNQTNGNQQTKITDGTDTALITAAGELNVISTAQPGTDIGDVTVNNGSGASAVNIQDGGNSITVDGAVTANLGTLNGAATSAKQDTGNTSLSSIDSKTPSQGQALAAASSPVVLPASQITALTPPAAITGYATETTLATRLSESDFDTKVGSLTETAPASDTASSGLNGRLQRVAQRITSLIALLPGSLGQKARASSFAVTLSSEDITALTPPAAISGFATSTKQSDGTQKSQVVDGSGNVIGSTSNALDVNIKSGASSGTQYADGAVRGTATGTVAMVDDGTNIQSAKGDTDGTLNVNNTKLAGTAVDTNSGNKSAGTQRVVLATDQPALTNALKVDGSAVTQPVSGSITANIGTSGSLALDATLTGGTQKAITRGGAKGTTTAADVTSSASGSNHQPLDVAIYDAAGNQVTSFGGGTQYTEDGASAGGESLTLAGAVRQDTISSSTSTDGDYANLKVNSVGRLYASATIDAALPAGTNAIGKLAVNDGVDIGDVTINNASGASAVNIQDGGNSITVDGTVTANAGTGPWPVTDNGGSLTVDNGGTFAVQATLAAGAASIGKAEDVASADADVGVPSMAVRKATPANTSGTDGDYEMLQMSAGRLWVDASGKTLTVDGSGVTQPVSGTITANAGTGNFTVVQGTATSLKAQAENYQGGTAVGSGNPLQVTLANTGANATAVKTDSSATTQPISASTLPLPTGAAADATLTGGTAKSIVRGGAKGSTTAADVTSTSSGANHNVLDVAIYDGSGNQVTTFGGGTQYTEDAAAAADPVGNMGMAVRQDTLSGTTVSADGDNIALRATGKGEMYVKHVDAIPITDNSGSLTVDNGGTFAVQNNAATPAGTNLIGKVGIDQTTPGTTNAVSATNLPTTVDTNSGNKSASTLRTVLATDQPALTTAGVFSVKTDQTTHGTTDLVAADITKVAGASVATGHGTASGAIRVELPTDGTGVVNAAQSGTWTNTVTQATAANLNATVVGTGTFAVQAAQSGTWTVQPGNTANTTPWLVSDTGSGTVSTANSTTTNLAGGVAFTGTGEDVTKYAAIQVAVFSSHASATDGLSLQQSSDNTNWDFVDTYTVVAATGKVFSVQPTSQYFRLVYTNGATLTTSLRIKTVYHVNAPNPSSQRTSDAYTNETDLTQLWSFNSVFNGTTWDRSRSAAGVTGALAVGGLTASGSTLAAAPITGGGLAKTANPTAVTDGQVVNSLHDKLGKQVVVGSLRDLKANQVTTITSSTTETTIVTAVASTFLDLYGLIITNTSATAVNVAIKDATAGTTRFNIAVPAGDTRGFTLPESGAIKQATVNNNWTATSSASVASLVITALTVANT